MGTMKVQEIVRKVLQTPLFLQRNACGIAQPRTALGLRRSPLL